MKELQQQLNKIYALIQDYPITSVSLTVFGLLIVILRKIHQRFIVHPQIGGRHNNQNSIGYRHPREIRLDAQDIQIVTEKDIKLRGWYIKHPKAEQILIYYHQNAGNIGGRLYYVRQLLKNSSTSVLLIAYRGFSDSDGQKKPIQSQIMKDATAILMKGIQIANKQKLPLFVFGRSLGGAAAIHALSQPGLRYAAKGLILENTFTSIYDVAANFIPYYLFPLKWILWLITSSSYKSISKINKVQIPILFIKGRQDSLVPAKLMDRLQKESERNKKNQYFSLQVQNGTHNDTWYRAGQIYFQRINEFMYSFQN